MSNFQKGDIIRKKNGKRTAEVLEIGDRWGNARIKWQHSGITNTVYGNDINSFVLAEGGEEVNTMTLFEFEKDGKKVIASKLMEKSNKEWIMEIKGSGEVLVVDASTVSEIVPYTIDVLIDGRESSYRAEKGEYKKDEVYVMGKTLTLAKILKVDTKKKNARGVFKPLGKLVIEYNNHKENDV